MIKFGKIGKIGKIENYIYYPLKIPKEDRSFEKSKTFLDMNNFQKNYKRF